MSTEEEKEPGETEGETAPDVELQQAQLEEAQREVDQFRNLLQRVQADSVNYKRRVEEEREELQKRANANLVIRLLPVLDDFERALQHIPTDDALSPWLAGVELVYHNLKGVLESFGVTQIEALDKTFDPLEHESVFYEVSEDHEEGKVMSIVREGYKLHGRVLRPAQVTVSKRKEEESSHEEISDSSGKETE
ncbi:MAG: nucleotide exchange factor GrpE [Planctomycetes bacterium]|nr:nucleotide exchange factor GrpE [Planctomycetota bacterium]